jgi:formate C-acetyltransferase
MLEQWNGFKSGKWMKEVNVRDFIQKNYTPYTEDESFLTGATQRTQALWNQVKELMMVERSKGILDTDTEVVSTITSHQPGYINRELEQIVVCVKSFGRLEKRTAKNAKGAKKELRREDSPKLMT